MEGMVMNTREEGEMPNLVLQTLKEIIENADNIEPEWAGKSYTLDDPNLPVQAGVRSVVRRMKALL